MTRQSLPPDAHKPDAPKVPFPRRRTWFGGMTLLSLSIAVVLLILALRDVDWRQAVAAARDAEPAPAIVAFVLLSTSYLLRGLRWRALLSQRITITIATSFWTTALSYLANAFLPARAGDLLRAEIIRRHAGYGERAFLLATVIVERIAEICTLVAISLIALATLPVLPEWLQAATQAMGVVALIGAVGIVLARRAERIAIAFIGVLPVSAAIRVRLSHLIEQASLGAQALTEPRTVLIFVTTTALIWVLEIGYTITIAQALNQQLTIAQGVLLLAALGLASAIPSTPGYVGVFQFVAVTVLAPFGFAAHQALVYILLFQLLQYIAVILWGSIGAIRLRVTRQIFAPGSTGTGPTPSASIEETGELRV